MAEPQTMEDTVSWPTITGSRNPGVHAVMTKGSAVAWAAWAFRERTICR